MLTSTATAAHLPGVFGPLCARLRAGGPTAENRLMRSTVLALMREEPFACDPLARLGAASSALLTSAIDYLWAEGLTEDERVDIEAAFDDAAAAWG